MLIGAIEAGGTKMVCAAVNENGQVLDRVTIPTTLPDETRKRMLDYFKGIQIEALGIGCFGPVDLCVKSPTYGYITSTPKPGWSDCDFAGYFAGELGVPVGFDTDVNAAVLGEVLYGSARGCDCAIYVTIGTGIGVGVYANGGLLHGLMHPEAGHILLARHPGDTFPGKCPFHDNCAEGLASGPAMEARYGIKASLLDAADAKTDYAMAWELESFYIAQAVTNYILCYSPQKVILWGGVMHHDGLIEMVREKVKTMLNGYVKKSEIIEHIGDYIVFPALGEDTGIIGAAGLGMQQKQRADKLLNTGVMN